MTTSTRARSKRVATLARHAQAEASAMEQRAAGDRTLRGLRRAHQAMRDLVDAHREITASVQAGRRGAHRTCQLLAEYDFAGASLIDVSKRATGTTWDGAERRRTDRRRPTEQAA